MERWHRWCETKATTRESAVVDLRRRDGWAELSCWGFLNMDFGADWMSLYTRFFFGWECPCRRVPNKVPWPHLAGTRVLSLHGENCRSCQQLAACRIHQCSSVYLLLLGACTEAKAACTAHMKYSPMSGGPNMLDRTARAGLFSGVGYHVMLLSTAQKSS